MPKVEGLETLYLDPILQGLKQSGFLRETNINTAEERQWQKVLYINNGFTLYFNIQWI